MDWQEALGNVFANTRKVFGVTPYRTTGVWDMPENLPQETPAAVSPVAPVGGLSYDPSTGVVSGSPIKKEVPGLSDLVNKFSGSFSNFKSSPISSSPVLSDEMKANIQKQTGPVTGLGDDYWKGISDQATKRLHEQYFDRGGLYDQAQENYASRGLVGSGVEQQLLSDQVYKPYSQEVSDVVSQIASEQTKYGVDIEKFNRELGLKGTEMLTNLAIADKQMGQQAEIANKNIEYQYNSLSSQLAQAERGMLSNEAMADVDRQIAQMELAVNSYNTWKTNELNEKKYKLDTIIAMGNVDPTDTAAIARLTEMSGDKNTADELRKYGTYELKKEQLWKQYLAQANSNNMGQYGMKSHVVAPEQWEDLYNEMMAGGGVSGKDAERVFYNKFIPALKGKYNW